MAQLNTISNHIVQTLRAVHQDDKAYVDNVEAKLDGRGELDSLLYLNALDNRELNTLAKRLKLDNARLRQVGETLKAF